MRVRRYKTASFRDYFLGARAVLDILFKFAPGMESGRKNEGFILDLLMQFNVFNGVKTYFKIQKAFRFSN